MSSDDFDTEMAKLYQQRKAQIIAPQISFKEQEKSRRFSPTSLLAIFSAAGFASFGIMAIISHLSTAPIQTSPLYNSNHQIDIIEITSNEDDKNNMPIIPPLPPKPIIKQPSKTFPLDVEKQVNKTIIAPETLATAQVQFVTLPQLIEPKLAIKPIYKVLPKYSLSALQSKQSGEIQLKYQITPSGSVKNITILKSSVSRKLQQSTKKALAKWQYTPSNSFKESYQIVFEFKADKS